MGLVGRLVAGTGVAALLACAPAAGAAIPRTVERDGAAPAVASTFAAHRIARAPGWSFAAVAAADLDGDGQRDVVGLDPERGVVVARALGRGRFTTRRYRGLFPFRAGEQLGVGDVDGDGRPDLVTTGRRDRAPRITLVVQVAYGRPEGFSRARPSKEVADPESVSALAVGDVDGDGRTDAIVALSYQEGHRSRGGDGVAVLRGRASRRLAPRAFPTALTGNAEDRGFGPPRILAGDVDGDGALDLVARGTLVRGLGGGRFGRPVALGPGTAGLNSQSLARTFVRRGRGLDLVGAFTRSQDGIARAGVIARGARVQRPATVTRLHVRSDDGAFRVPVNGQPGAVVAGRLRRVPGFDAAFAGGPVVWVAHTTDGVRFGAAVPTVLPAGAGVLAMEDIDADGRDEILGNDARGGLLLLRATGLAPLARPVLPRTAPLIAADHTSYPALGCTAGAGACIGVLELPGGLRPLRIASGDRVRFQLRTDPALAPSARVTLRWSSLLRGASRPLTLTAPTRGDVARACAPPPGERVLARGRDFVVVRGRTYLEIEASRRSSARP